MILLASVLFCFWSGVMPICDVTDDQYTSAEVYYTLDSALMYHRPITRPFEFTPAALFIVNHNDRLMFGVLYDTDTEYQAICIQREALGVCGFIHESISTAIYNAVLRTP